MGKTVERNEMKRHALILSLAVFAASLAAAPAPQGAPPIPGTETVELSSNERDLYPRLEDVAIRAIERLPGEVGVSLDLMSDMPGFSHFVSSRNGEPFRKVEGGRLVLRFEDRHTPDVQVTDTIVRAVDKDYLNRPVAKLPAAPAAHAAEPAGEPGGPGAQ